MTTLSASKTKDPMAEVSKNLRKLRDKQKPPLAYKVIERRIWRLLDGEGPTAETIRQYHIGQVTGERVNLEWLAAICAVYGVTITDVSAELGERATARAELLLGRMEPNARLLTFTDDEITFPADGGTVESGRGTLGDSAWTTPACSPATHATNNAVGSPKQRSVRTRRSTGRSVETSQQAA